MKRILFFACMAILLCSLFACSKSENADNANTVSNKQKESESLIKINDVLSFENNSGQILSFDKSYDDISKILYSLSEYPIEESNGSISGTFFSESLPDSGTYTGAITAGYVGSGAGYVQVGFDGSTLTRIDVYGAGNEFSFNGLMADKTERDELIEKYKYFCEVPNVSEQTFWFELYFVDNENEVFLVVPNIVKEDVFTTGTEYIEGEYSADILEPFENDNLYRMCWSVSYDSSFEVKSGMVTSISLMRIGK